MDFRQFLIAEAKSAAMTDVNKTLGKLPKKHRALFKGYKYIFEPNNSLKGDSDHIGFIDEEKKTIRVCAPWYYSREMTLLHEIAHIIWKHILDKKQRKEWKRIVKNTKNKQDQNIEELFCMAYGATYAKHGPVTHTKKAWSRFIKHL